MFFSVLLLLLITKHSFPDCSWNRCHGISNDKQVITAHLIPHTHDDLGWIKTVDQYYYGARPDLVPVGVQYIYNTVIDELLKNPDRRFSFAETGFLWRWFTSNSDFDRHQLQKLVKNGQIELIGGGWVQNDEATSHYVDIIDQMTLGLNKLSQIFGECGKPKAGWQIDPFGHSREMANLYSQMGYTSLYFARIHYLEKELRLKNKTLEVQWNASDDLDSKIFTGAFFQDNYGPPEGFCWDTLCGDDPIMDNIELEEYNVGQKVDAFVKHVMKQASHQTHNQVMLLMGSDFQYTNANSWYINLDKLIKYVNGNSSTNVKVIYSTPSCYTQAVQNEQKDFSEKADDYFPYASASHSYWTGYFTSRPGFKGMIRKASAMLQLAKQLEVIADLGAEDDSDVEVLRKASALNQHHDAVTGTAKENVTRDYKKQLSRGMQEVEIVINDFMKKINPNALNSNLILCPLINETICKPIRNLSEFSVVVFNSNGKWHNGTIRIPIYKNGASVFSSENENVPHEVVKTFQVNSLQDIDRAPYEIYVFLSIPPLGYTTISVSVRENKKERAIGRSKPKNVTIENEHLIVGFDDDGYVSYLIDKETGIIKSIRQEFFYYEGVDNKDDQPSGAYIFRPKTSSPISLNDFLQVQVLKGTVVNEVRQVVTAWISQIIRLPKGKKYLEFEWIVGPIPKEKKFPVTKEIVTRYTADIDSENVFYTDSNGRQTMRRVYGEATSFKYSDDEPIAGNYYPMTSFAYIKDNNFQLSVVTDRSQGMTSMTGYIEVMIHRRCFYDDHFGVEEALDEPGKLGTGLVAMGKHILLFTHNKISSESLRPLIIENFNSPVIAISKDKKPEKFEYHRQLQYSELQQELPIYLNLLTLERWHKKNLLLRFEHIYHKSDESKYGTLQTFNFMNLFKSFKIVSAKQLLLAANRNATQYMSKFRHSKLGSFSIRPSEILTFEVEIERK